jgi:hypothetical protein
MEPWMWVLIGIVGVLLLIVLFRAAMAPRRPVGGRPVARRPLFGWRRPGPRRAYWR